MSNSSNRGRWGRGLLILILLLVVGGVAAWIAIPRLLDINTYRSTIEAEAERRLGRPITVGQMELTAFPQPTAVIHDLTVAGQGLEGQTVLRVPTLRAQARLLPLLTARRLELVGLTLENPEIVLVRGATGPWNWQTMLQPKAAGTGGSAGSSGHWQPERVTITKGTLRIVDEQAEPGRTVSSIVQPLDLDIRPGGAGRPSQVDLDLVLANATERGGLHYAGRIGPFPTPFDVARLPLAGDLATKRFPLRLLLPYVRREDGIRALDGFVSSDLRLALKPGSELQMKGDLALDQVHYELGGAAPRAGRLDFASKVDLTAHGRQDLDLRQLEVTLPDGRLTLAGELRNVANAQGGHVALRVDGQHVNLPALAPLAELAGFELPATPLGAQPFDIAGAIEGQGAGFVMRDLRLKSALAGGGDLTFEGTLGPSAGGQLPIDGRLRLAQATMAGMRSLLGGASGLPATGTADLDATVRGRAPERLAIKGTAALHGVAVELGRPGTPREVVDGDLVFDVDSEQGGRHLTFRSCQVKLPSGTFAFTGTLDRQPGATLADLSVAPTRIKIEELQQLATWMGIGLPGAMRSPDPVAVALRAQGNLTDKSQLRLTGSLQATRLAWEAPFLHQPLEDVAATVRFAGDGFETKGFTAKLGGTTWRGDLAVQDLGAPKVQFALATPQADLGQLMSAFGSGGPGGTGNAPTGSQRVNNVTGGGTIAIASGTFNTLVFSDLQARVELAGGTIRLAPLDFGLYGGKYAGQSTVDLRGQVPIIQHDCALVGVDANGLLSTNPKLKDVLHGTLAARFDGAGSGQTMESLLGSLTGSGDFKIVNGTLTRSSMLKGLSDVAGLFGERTLTQLSARMTTNETPFSALSGAFRVAGGQLTTDNLLLTTSDFSLAAKGRVAIDKRLGFQGRIVFSDAISRTLREEGSRAVYLGEDNGRVAIPVAVSGTLDRPAFEVDFGAAAGYAVSKTITDRIAEALERRQAPKPPPAEPPAVKAPANPLKVQQPPVATPPASKSPAPATPPASKSPAPATPPASKPPTPAPSKSPTDTTASAGKAPPPAPEKESPPPSPEKNPEPDQKAEKSEPAPADLRVRVESHALAGDRAQPDLAVKGSVSGSHLAGLLVVVTDDGGRVVHQEKRLVKEIAAAYGTRSRNEAVTVPFAFQIAGARLPAKAKSVKMTLTAVADNGQRSPPASIAQPMPRGT